MHPARELNRLAACKAERQREIALHRAVCAGAAVRVAQPLAWVDHKLALWRKLSPFAKFVALPLGLLLKRTTAPRWRMVGRLLRWGPLVLGAIRSLSARHPAAPRA